MGGKNNGSSKKRKRGGGGGGGGGGGKSAADKAAEKAAKAAAAAALAAIDPEVLALDSYLSGVLDLIPAAQYIKRTDAEKEEEWLARQKFVKNKKGVAPKQQVKPVFGRGAVVCCSRTITERGAPTFALSDLVARYPAVLAPPLGSGRR